MRTQLRIALILVVSNLLIVSILGGSIYYFISNYSYNDFYKRLETRAGIAYSYHFLTDEEGAENVKRVRDQHLEYLAEEKEYLFELNGPIDSALNASLPSDFFQNLLENGSARFQQGDTFYAGIMREVDDAPWAIIVSANNYYAGHHLLFLRNLLLISILLVILISVSTSIFFARSVFTPIRQITDQVKQISTNNMHQRIPEQKDDNEIGQLINTFNDLLTRIETAFETQKNFISNASHELGTPLTSIIGNAEVALIKERQSVEYKETIEEILHQAERLNQITKTLLLLAQTGYSNKRLQFEMCRMDELVWEAKRMTDHLNPSNTILFDLELMPENPLYLKVHGNKELLLLALTNILTNACKYSKNDMVTVSIACSDMHVIVVIKDKGIGIPAAELPFIYDPFFRASNTTSFGGYGIGLPLSRNIIHMHKGSITVTSPNQQGTTVEIKIPQAEAKVRTDNSSHY